MGFDPRREDYLRLSYSYFTQKGCRNYEIPDEIFDNFAELFESDSPNMVLYDEDQAFHLTCKAASILDYEIPFLSDPNQVRELEQKALMMLKEAEELDKHCFDAERILSLTRVNTLEEHYRYLIDNLPNVREYCCNKSQEILAREDYNELDFTRVHSILTPYFRWVAQTAMRAFMTGRYREAVSLALQLLDFDELDSTDIRFVAYLSLAQMQDSQMLTKLIETQNKHSHGRNCPSAWESLALAALHYKNLDLADAKNHLMDIAHNYQNGATALFRQIEVPMGVFSRVNAESQSENEAVIAISEALPLLHFGKGFGGSNITFGDWISNLDEIIELDYQDHDLEDSNGDTERNEL